MSQPGAASLPLCAQPQKGSAENLTPGIINVYVEAVLLLTPDVPLKAEST